MKKKKKKKNSFAFQKAKKGKNEREFAGVILGNSFRATCLHIYQNAPLF
jgi:hypothetical protein